MQRTQRIVQAAVSGLLLALGTAPAAQAQSSSAKKLPVLVGLNAAYARPQGEFLDAVKQGWGGGGNLLLPIGDGILNFRADLGYIGYGRDRRDIDLFGFLVSQTTTNNIFTFDVGPQLMATSGVIRPYVNATAGIARFYTQSSLDDIESVYFQTSSTQSDNWKFAYGVGGGAYIPFAVMRIPLLLDIGAAYSDNGRATYLTKNDITVDSVSGNAIISKRKTPVQFMTYRLGISVAF